MNQMEAIDIVTVHEVVKEKVNLLNRNTVSYTHLRAHET